MAALYLFKFSLLYEEASPISESDVADERKITQSVVECYCYFIFDGDWLTGEHVGISRN